MDTTDKSLRDYFLIVFLIPISAVILATFLYGMQSELVTTQLTARSMIVVMAMVHAPLIAAAYVVYRDDGFNGIAALFGQLKYWRYNLGWYAKALLVIPGTILVSLLALSMYDDTYRPVLFLGILAFAVVFSSLWEEIGWTGYATPRMLKRYSPLKTAFLLGLVHASWHYAANYWGSRAFFGTLELYVFQLILTTLGIILLRVITIWIYVRTRSLVLCWLTHFGYTGGQIIFVSLTFSAMETILWNSVFVAMLIVVVATMFVLNRDFRGVWFGR